MTGKLWIFFVLCLGAVVGQDDENSMELGGWNYDDWFDEVEDQDKLEGDQNSSREQVDYDHYADADFDALFKDVKEDADDYKADNLHNDYQIEDNRSAPSDGEQIAPSEEKLLEDENINNDDHLDVPETSVEEQIQDAVIQDIPKENKEKTPENQQLGQDEKEVNEQEEKEAIEQEVKEAEESFSYERVPESDLRGVPEVRNVLDAPTIEDVVAKSEDEPQDENGSNQDNSKSIEISFETNSDLKPMPLPPVGVIDEETKKIFAETQDILNKEEGIALEDKIAIEMPSVDNTQPIVSEIDNIQKDIDETQQLLSEIDNISILLDENQQPAPEFDNDPREIDKNQPLISDTVKVPQELDNAPLSAIDDILKTIDETEQLLSEIDNISNDKDVLEPEASKDSDNLKNEPDFPDLDKDTVDKAYNDLNADLDKLMDTWKKLAMGDIEAEPNPDDSINFDNVADYEEKNGRPFREGLILSQRDDYYEDVKNNDNIVESPTEEKGVNPIDQDLEKASDVELNDFQEVGDEDRKDNVDIPEEPIAEQENKDDQDIKMLPEDFSIENRNSLDDVIPPAEPVNDNTQVEKELKLEIFAVAATESEVDNKPEKPILYLQDAIPAKEDEELIVYKKAEEADEDKVPAIDVSDLSPPQYDQLMKQFKYLHGEEFDVHSDTSRKREVKDPIKLSVDKIEEVTSTGYPGMYPVGVETDWIFEGDGMGIEFNITDLFVNGVNGDYLLVKPGGVDELGHEGLLFSYRLTEPRKYRFLDVDRLFVRFVANPSFWGLYRGFKFSVKMVAPLPRMDEDVPEPEPIVPEVKETHAVFLDIGTRTLAEFQNSSVEFRELLANMATMYINANSIPMGMNTTTEVTQLTNIGVCHMSWPGTSQCARVTFAVPLVYEDESQEYMLGQKQLEDMWNTYKTQDPFATMLRRMEISEFVPPNDRGLLAVWSMIGIGVVVCVFMVGLVLWRYRAFENYTRMPEPSDNGSFYNEKPGLDLYPTPHQTLPPLWADQDDTTRVDMGGFTNNNFVRDHPFELDSDEEILSRDRYTTDV